MILMKKLSHLNLIFLSLTVTDDLSGHQKLRKQTLICLCSAGKKYFSIQLINRETVR